MGRVSGNLTHILSVVLRRSAEKGKIETTKCLLIEGALPDGPPDGRPSPLLLAVERNRLGIVRLLLEHGANLETRDKEGRTAMMKAALKNNWQVLNWLIKRGADVNGKDYCERNVLHNLAADDVLCDELNQYRNGDAVKRAKARSIGSSILGAKAKERRRRREEENRSQSALRG